MNSIEVFAWGNGDALFGLFNAVAALMQHATYTASLAIVLFIGFIAAGIAYAFAPHLMLGWKWLATVVLVFSVLVVPRTTVLINDKFSAAPHRVIANVPFGLALVAGLTSAISSNLTDVTETVFSTIPASTGLSLPQELTYSQNGMTFGNRVVLQTQSASFTDAYFRTDVINYMRNCAFPDLASGHIAMSTWDQSTNIWSILNDSNPARYTTIWLANRSLDVVGCPDAYRALDAKMPAQVQEAKSALSYALNVAVAPESAVTRIDAQVERAYATLRIGQAAQGAADLIRQNAMINSVRDAHLVQSQAQGDSPAMMLALSRAQGIAAANMAFRNAAVVQVQSMPIIRSALEFVLYALFPFVVLMLLLTHGQTAMTLLKTYAMTAIWVQLWPPMFAVVSYLVTIYSAAEIAAAAKLGGGAGAGLALFTADAIYSTSLSTTSVVSTMFVIVPIMAAAIVFGADKILSFAGSALASAQRPIDTASSAASSGNISFGNMTSDQLKMAPSFASPYMTESSDAFGRTTSGLGASASGTERFFASISQLPTSLTFGQGEAAKAAESAKESLTLSTRESESASAAQATALNQALGIQGQFNKSHERGGGSNVSSGAGESSNLNELFQLSQKVNERYGFDKASAFGTSIVGAVGGGVKTPIFSATVSAAQKADWTHKWSEAHQYATDAAASQGITLGKDVTNKFTTSDAYSWAKREGTSATEQFDASLSKSRQHQTSSEKALADSKEQSRVSEVMHDWSNRLDTNASNWVVDKLINTGRMGKYKNAGPEEQTSMVMTLAKEYARPGGGMVDGVYRPMAGPDPMRVDVGSMNLQEAYRNRGVRGSGDVDATWNTNKNIIRGEQRKQEVQPARGNVRDDVTPNADAAKERVLKSIQEHETTYNDTSAAQFAKTGHYLKTEPQSDSAKKNPPSP